jgi:hypothetical protein
MVEPLELPRASRLKELKEKRRAESRLSLPYPTRLAVATTLSFLVGASLGLSHGAQMAGFRFRAENAHRLPQTPTGWYLYHKSKNYHMALGGVKEGLKMGFKVSAWVAAFFALEDCWDRIRGKKDLVNTVMSSLTVAGGFSLWSMSRPRLHGYWELIDVTDRFPLTTAARTAKTGLAIGLGFGLAQDAVGLLRGRRPGYVDFVMRGGKGKAEEKEMDIP